MNDTSAIGWYMIEHGIDPVILSGFPKRLSELSPPIGHAAIHKWHDQEARAHVSERGLAVVMGRRAEVAGVVGLDEEKMMWLIFRLHNFFEFASDCVYVKSLNSNRCYYTLDEARLGRSCCDESMQVMAVSARRG